MLFVHMVDVVISCSVDVTSGTVAPETYSVSSRAVVTVSAVRKRRSESSFRPVVPRDSCTSHVSVLFEGRLLKNSNGDGVAATSLVGPWELLAVVLPLVESPSELVYADFEGTISVTE